MIQRKTLFVYGTLMKGLMWSPLLDLYPYLGPATLLDEGSLVLLKGTQHPIPALDQDIPETGVVGELYRVPLKMLENHFDLFEGGAGYCRVTMMALLAGKSKPVEVEVYIYGLSTTGLERIGGDFRAYLRGRENGQTTE